MLNLLLRIVPMLGFLVRFLQTSAWVAIERLFSLISVTFTALNFWTFIKSYIQKK